MKPLRIIFTNIGKIWGGQEELALEEALWLIKHGHTVMLVCMVNEEMDRRARAAGIPVENLAMTSLTLFSDFCKLVKIVWRFRPDIFHTRESRDTWRCVAFRFLGYPIFRTRHWALPLPPKARQWVWKYGTTHHFVCGSHIRDVLIKGIGLPQERVSLVMEATDLERFQPRGKKAIRAELNLPNDALVFGFVGRISSEKNPIGFLQAAKSVSEKFPNARFIVAGSPTNDMRVYADKFEALRDSLFPHDTHIFQLLGFRADVECVMNALDVLVMSSHQEGQPRVIPQAFATGIPVIAPRIGGIPDLVQHEENGLLVEPANVQALAAAMLHLAQDETLRNRLGAEGLRFAREKLSFDQRMNAQLACYAKAM